MEKRIVFLLLAALVLMFAAEAYAQPVTGGGPVTEWRQPVNIQLTLNDNIKTCWGTGEDFCIRAAGGSAWQYITSDSDGAGTDYTLINVVAGDTYWTFRDSSKVGFGDGAANVPDYWMRFNGSQWELNTSDIDGSGTDGVVISIDDDDANVDFSGRKGVGTTLAYKTESVTFAGNPGDATKSTTGSALPDGAWVVGVTYRVTTAGTNCGGFDIGPAAGDDDLYGSDIAVSANTTGDNTDATATWANPILANTEITVTGTNGAGVATNCFDMVVAITTHYFDVSAATSN